ncbi:MAG: zinc ribbon domain-containing protein [Deltaproteobacteria bacterium]|jgi:putative FmdB family regulatory protein|nr:zinc ribbon domain-containing protein [Deltaproteobacteria bacterium]
MPIYEYKCPQCGQEFETLVTRSQELIACPGCGHERCDKLMSSFRSLGGSKSPDGLGGSYASSGSGCGSCSSSSCAGCASH